MKKINSYIMGGILILVLLFSVSLVQARTFKLITHGINKMRINDQGYYQFQSKSGVWTRSILLNCPYRSVQLLNRTRSAKIRGKLYTQRFVKAVYPGSCIVKVTRPGKTYLFRIKVLHNIRTLNRKKRLTAKIGSDRLVYNGERGKNYTFEITSNHVKKAEKKGNQYFFNIKKRGQCYIRVYLVNYKKKTHARSSRGRRRISARTPKRTKGRGKGAGSMTKKEIQVILVKIIHR